MKIFLLLSICVVSVQTFKTPRCQSNFLFDQTKADNDVIYQNAWKEPCSIELRGICRKNISLAYMKMEPFSSSVEFNKTEWPKTGLMQQILSVAFAECCGSCINITFNRLANRTELIAATTTQSRDILMPIFSQGRDYNLNSTIPLMNIPIIHLSSAMFITKSSLSAKLFAKEIINAIIDIWPLLGVAILMAFAAGVAIWITDTWWNKEHFPRRFVSGAFEGFWWAFISMTTVGYGDRVPRSVPGRLISVLWILCGMTICSLLTAALTTAIVSVAQMQHPSINRGRIGVLRDRIFEKSILMKGNADKHYMGSVDQLSKAVINGDIEGMLVDIYTAKYSNRLINEDLFVDSIIQDTDLSYLGISIYDEDLYGLIYEYIYLHKDYIKDFIFDTFRSMEELKSPDIAANLIFTTQSGMFEPIFYTCLVVLGISLLVGAVYEAYSYKKRKQLHLTRKASVVTLKTLKKQETMLQDEIQLVLDRWDKYLRTMIKTYSIEGMFTKSSNNFPNVIIKIAPFTKEKDYTGDTYTVEEGVDDRSLPLKPSKKVKAKSNKISPSQKTEKTNLVDSTPTGSYIRLKNTDNDGRKQNSPVVSTKVKKKQKPKVKKKRKKLLHTEDEPQEIYGSINIHSGTNGHTNRTLPHSRRLPPLNPEDMV